MKNKIPTWGYSKNDSKIFELEEGQELPKGYYDSPARIPVKKSTKKDPVAETGDDE